MNVIDRVCLWQWQRFKLCVSLWGPKQQFIHLCPKTKLQLISAAEFAQLKLLSSLFRNRINPPFRCREINSAFNWCELGLALLRECQDGVRWNPSPTATETELQSWAQHGKCLWLGSREEPCPWHYTRDSCWLGRGSVQSRGWTCVWQREPPNTLYCSGEKGQLATPYVSPLCLG